jgi:hypothetical protein
MTRSALALTLVLCPATLLRAQPLGSAFTYQGRLVENGTPATGAYDFQLRLFDAPAGGAQVGATLARDDVPVGDGLFTVSLDFGAGAFTGNARWLEMAVRPGASTGAYTTLPARQELTPAPNALFGATAPWAGVTGKPAGFADDIDNDSGGDITGVTTGAASGLTGGAASGTANLAVSFAGSGAAATVSRSDHQHLGQTWSAVVNPGLAITSAAANGTVLSAAATNVGGLTYGIRGSSTSSNGVGLFGEVTSSSGPTYAVLGHTHSSAGTGVHGIAIGTTGNTYGVQGWSGSTNGRGVFGHALATSGSSHGVFGQTDSGGGLLVTSGVTGHATHPTGVTFGVRGLVESANGIGVLGSATATSGTAIGVWGRTDTIGGVGVVAEGQGNNNAAIALEIRHGRIKIDGAGDNTATPAFRIPQGTGECGVDGAFVVIDHPHANFNANAIVMVTPTIAPHSFAVFYWTGGGVCPNNRWLIWRGSAPVSAGYNVLVLVP